jgi:hypothetical protein
VKSSSKHNPCPICGRSTNDRCRISDDQILCYRGKSFGPPDLAIGETIEIDGIEWAYVKDMAGFSGNSALFVVHDESTAPRKIASPAEVRQQAVRALYEVGRFEKDVELAAWSLRQVEELELFEHMPPDRIRESLDICRDAFALHKHLVAQCRRLRRQLPDVGNTAEILQAGLKAIKWQGMELKRLWFDELCDPASGRGQRLAIELQLHRLLPEVEA